MSRLQSKINHHTENQEDCPEKGQSIDTTKKTEVLEFYDKDFFKSL